MDLKGLYETNADFRRYVDRYCKNSHEGKGCSLEEALEHEVVRQVAEQYREQEESKVCD